MKIQSKAMVGLAVYTTTQGEKLGQVKDYIFYPEKKSILALVISKGKPFGEELILPIANMKSMGQGAVTVTSRDALITKEADPEIHKYLKRMANIVGIQVMTADGTSLGNVTSFTMDTETGAILDLSLSKGMMEQLFKGRNSLSTDAIDVFGTDVILAKDDAVAYSEKEILEDTDEKPKTVSSNRIWNKSLSAVKAKGKSLKMDNIKTVFPEVPKMKAEEAKEIEKVQEESRASTAQEKTVKTSIGFKKDVE